MQPAPQFLTEAQQRLDDFYRKLAQWGEVAPGLRFRLEGFLEAGLTLGLVEGQQLQVMIETSYRTFLGRAPEPVPGSDPIVQLPVRWQRAPVYRSGEGEGEVK
jgi:hypothetical protein